MIKERIAHRQDRKCGLESTSEKSDRLKFGGRF